jgi:uncharacterized protein with PQ loop repeat
MFDATFLLGLMGSITAATLFFPQVWTSFRSKKTKNLSWFTISLGVLNGAAWIAYGIRKEDPFIYATNAFLFLSTLLLAVLKKKYG